MLDQMNGCGLRHKRGVKKQHPRPKGKRSQRRAASVFLMAVDEEERGPGSDQDAADDIPGDEGGFVCPEAAVEFVVLCSAVGAPRFMTLRNDVVDVPHVSVPQFQIPSNQFNSSGFDFCISNIEVLVN
jgi:hypothetical protein